MSSAWRIEFKGRAVKQLGSLDRSTQERIRSFLVFLCPANPRLHGKPLRGELAGLFRYRVGHYRLLCHIQDDRLVVLILKIGHRRDVYRG